MPTAQQSAALNVYQKLMEEARIRLTFLENSLINESNMPGQMISEFCYLQLRLLCEIVAIACLVVHGDIASSAGSLQKEWAADKIIKKLTEIHPLFYPRPFSALLVAPGQWHFGPAPAGHLTKEELLQLYGLCGNELHRGNLKKLLAYRMPILKNFDQIREWHWKMRLLLDQHHMSLLDQKTVFFCHLKQEKNVLRVEVGIGEAVPAG